MIQMGSRGINMKPEELRNIKKLLLKRLNKLIQDRADRI